MKRSNQCEENDYRYTPLDVMDAIFGPALVYDLAADDIVPTAGAPDHAVVTYNTDHDLLTDEGHMNIVADIQIVGGVDYLFINPPYSKMAGGIGVFWKAAVAVANDVGVPLVMLTNSRSSSSQWYHDALKMSQFSCNLNSRISFDIISPARPVRVPQKGNAAAQTLFVYSPYDSIPSRLLARIDMMGTCQTVIEWEDDADE